MASVLHALAQLAGALENLQQLQVVQKLEKSGGTRVSPDHVS